MSEITIKISKKLEKIVNQLSKDYANSTGADDINYYRKYYLDLIPHLYINEATIQMMGWALKKDTIFVELGSGIGTKCILVKAIYGSKVIGIEPYPNTYSKLKEGIDEFINSNKKFKYEVFNDFGEDLRSLENDSVDYLVSHEVMEHVVDTQKVVKEIYRVLKPGGSAFIATCNYDSFYDGHFRVFLPPIKSKLFRKLWMRLHGFNTKFVDEINFVTKKSLKRDLENTKFENIYFFEDLNFSGNLPELNVDYPQGFRFAEVSRGITPIQKFIQRHDVSNILRRYDREYKIYVGIKKPL